MGTHWSDVNVTSSEQIPIAWTHVPHICLLCLCHIRAPPLGGPSPILIPAGKGIERTHQGREAAKANAERELVTILGRVLRSEGEGRNDAADVTEADLPGGADSASAVATEVQCKPADLNCVRTSVATVDLPFKLLSWIREGLYMDVD